MLPHNQPPSSHPASSGSQAPPLEIRSGDQEEERQLYLPPLCLPPFTRFRLLPPPPQDKAKCIQGWDSRVPVCLLKPPISWRERPELDSLCQWWPGKRRSMAHPRLIFPESPPLPPLSSEQGEPSNRSLRRQRLLAYLRRRRSQLWICLDHLIIPAFLVAGVILAAWLMIGD
jgi:hypothetical protein